MYDSKRGYGLKLDKFDEQYEDCIIYRDSIEGVIKLADKILQSFGKRGLISELNEMQGYALYNDKMAGIFTEDELKKLCWYDKYQIPSYFINLLLKQYNMSVIGW